MTTSLPLLGSDLLHDKSRASIIAGKKELSEESYEDLDGEERPGAMPQPTVPFKELFFIQEMGSMKRVLGLFEQYDFDANKLNSSLFHIYYFSNPKSRPGHFMLQAFLFLSLHKDLDDPYRLNLMSAICHPAIVQDARHFIGETMSALDIYTILKTIGDIRPSLRKEFSTLEEREYPLQGGSKTEVLIQKLENLRDSPENRHVIIRGAVASGAFVKRSFFEGVRAIKRRLGHQRHYNSIQ